MAPSSRLLFLINYTPCADKCEWDIGILVYTRFFRIFVLNLYKGKVIRAL